MAGLAAGPGPRLQRIAEWCYVDLMASGGRGAFACRIKGRVWIGRNNDFRVPDLWGHAPVRAVEGLIPTIGLGLAGEPFTATGLNAERLWLHYNWQPVTDAPHGGRPSPVPYVWLTSALETCRSLDDVEAYLVETDRSDGMLLLATDGKSDEAAVFECGRASHVRIDLPDGGGVLVRTNHALALPAAGPISAGSLAMFARLSELVAGLASPPLPRGSRDARGSAQTARGIAAMLADDGVEQRQPDFGTVYAATCCPTNGELWHTFGGFPAASRGDWRWIEWRWTGQAGEIT